MQYSAEGGRYIGSSLSLFCPNACTQPPAADHHLRGSIAWVVLWLSNFEWLDLLTKVIGGEHIHFDEITSQPNDKKAFQRSSARFARQRHDPKYEEIISN